MVSAALALLLATACESSDRNHQPPPEAKQAVVTAPIETGLSSNLGKHGGMHEGPVPVRIVVDGAKVETYVGEQPTGRLADAVLPRSDALYIISSYVASEEYPLYVGTLRIVTLQG